MRLQLLREKIGLVHSILYTHYHVDHVFGLDDARIFPKQLGGALPIYCTDDVEEVIRKAFAYAFHPGNDGLPPGVLPRLVFHRITSEPCEAARTLSILRAVAPSIEKTVDHFEALRKRYRGATVNNAGKVRLREIA